MKIQWFPLFCGLLMAAGSAQAWYGAPGGPGYGYGPYAYPYDYPPPPSYGRSYQRGPSIRVNTRRDADGYLVSIQLQGLEPTDVTVARSGRWLIVQKIRSESESAQAPGSYSYSHSYGGVSRRVSLPRNADLDAMIREDGEGQILLRIPFLER
jgi:hypothetical protein